LEEWRWSGSEGLVSNASIASSRSPPLQTREKISLRVKQIVNDLVQKILKCASYTTQKSNKKSILKSFFRKSFSNFDSGAFHLYCTKLSPRLRQKKVGYLS
jgi:hypothetical protein